MGRKPEQISWCFPIAVAVWMSTVSRWEWLRSMVPCTLVPVLAEEQPLLSTLVQWYQSVCFRDRQVT